jgi:hypothetical protein
MRADFKDAAPANSVAQFLFERWALKTANFHEYQSAKPAPDLLEQASTPE